jgi:hypothetical protein
MTRWLLVPLVALVAALPAASATHREGSARAFALRPAPADTVCRESERAWHRASGDTLWLYILMDRASQRIDTQAVVFKGDSAVQLRPRPRRLGPTQATRLRTMHQKCAEPSARR